MSQGDPKTPVIRRPYCLRCYAGMEPYAGSRCVCGRCGFVNVKLDQELFWTKEKRFRDLEELAKTVIVFLMVGLVLVMARGLTSKMSFGMGQGWAVGFPILIGVILWETASKITRKKPYFRATIVWRIVLLILALPVLLAAAALRYEARMPIAAAIVLVIGAIMLAGVIGLGRLGRALASWRDRRILAGQHPGG